MSSRSRRARIDTYYRDGSLKKVTGTAVHGARYEYGLETYGATGDHADDFQSYTLEIKLNTDGTEFWSDNLVLQTLVVSLGVIMQSEFRNSAT